MERQTGLLENNSTERVKENGGGCYRVNEKELKKLGGWKDQREDTSSRGRGDSPEKQGLCSGRDRMERSLAAIWRKWLHVDRRCGISKGSLSGKIKMMGCSSGVGGLDMEQKQPIYVSLTDTYTPISGTPILGLNVRTRPLFLSSP